MDDPVFKFPDLKLRLQTSGSIRAGTKLTKWL